MLSTTCWLIWDDSEGAELDDRAYLHKKDAELIRDQALQMKPHKTLILTEKTLVLAFGVTDQRVTPESIFTLEPPCAHGNSGPCHNCTVDAACGR